MHILSLGLKRFAASALLCNSAETGNQSKVDGVTTWRRTWSRICQTSDMGGHPRPFSSSRSSMWLKVLSKTNIDHKNTSTDPSPNCYLIELETGKKKKKRWFIWTINSGMDCYRAQANWLSGHEEKEVNRLWRTASTFAILLGGKKSTIF